jgi:hypothetical protein
VRSGVRLLAGELHRTCVQFTWRDSDDAICLFLVPLFDAQVLLGEALAFEVLDRDRVTQAMASLQRVCDHIQTN